MKKVIIERDIIELGKKGIRVLIKTQDDNHGVFKLISKWSDLPIIETEVELQSVFSQIKRNEGYLERLSNSGKLFADNYYYATGSHAVQNIISEVSKIGNISI